MPCCSVKVDRFVSPPLEILLVSGDTGRPLLQDCLTLLVDLTTGHYNSSRTDSTSPWLTFLTSVQQSRTQNPPTTRHSFCRYVALSSLIVHFHCVFLFLPASELCSLPVVFTLYTSCTSLGSHCHWWGLLYSSWNVWLTWVIWYHEIGSYSVHIQSNPP